MASREIHGRSSSISSTMTGNILPPEEPTDNPADSNGTPLAEDSSDNNNLHTVTADAIPNDENVPENPPKPVPFGHESRDVSVCSRNTRDSLRRSVLQRSNTFTESERQFLEQLAIEGSDQEVECALKTVQDEDLFFEYATPRHLKHNFGQEDDIGLDIGLDINQSTSSGADDATRDSVAASVSTRERRGLDKAASSLTNSSNSMNNFRRSSNSSKRSSGAAPRVPSTILGSERRRAVLERRRSESSLNLATLWRAHESGLAVTSIGSQKSLIRRESSMSSFGSAMSGLSVLFGNRPHPGANQEDVFRSDRDATKEKEGDGKSMIPKARISTQLPPSGRKIPLIPRRAPLHRRSKSATLYSLARNLPPRGMMVPRGGARPTHARARSFGTAPGRAARKPSHAKRRSVTFHDIDEELEFDKELESISVTPVDAVDTIPKHSQKPRRAVSDSHISVPLELQQGLGKYDEQKRLAMQRDSSISSIPSLHQGRPIRQDSITSIPSLHRGNPLRDSISDASIPSLLHGNQLRDSMSVLGQSTSSIPSLHQAHPLRDSMSTFRRDSATSFASLHHANPIRQDSVTSFPSLHHGKPIRQESIASIPSIRHGKPIRQDSVASSVPPNSMTQEEMVQQFGVTDDIAAAWLQLATPNSTVDNNGDRRSSVLTGSSTLPSLPDDSSEATEPTVNTAIDRGEILPTNTAPTVDTTVMEEFEKVSAVNQEAIDKLVGSRPRPVHFRQASRNIYEGEGVEVTELDDQPLDGALSETDSYYYQNPTDLGVFRNASPFPTYGSIRTAGSFDDVSIFSTFGQQHRASEVFRDIRRSLSDESLGNFMGRNKEFLLQIPTGATTSETFADEMSDDGCSTAWEMEFAAPGSGRFDAWNILQDEYANGYGGAGTLGFKILGTSASDESAQPHVLSPPLMESLQAFLPPTKSGQNFHMKYSMIRDGASLQTLLKRARGIQYSILAVETIDGEVFGSFTGQAWRKSWNYFGTGESFLWRMRHSRLEQTNGILDQAQKESEVEVYPYTGENEFIQLCTHDRIAVGGGLPDADSSSEKKSQTEPSPIVSSPLADHDHDWGLGLALQADLLQGSSSPCLTFGSPSLCKSKPDGDRFEIINVELWTLTPCATEEEAEKLELGKLFLGSTRSAAYVNQSIDSGYAY